MREEIDDDRLAQWVRAVVQRWTETGVSARDRTRLFADLLRELVASRIKPTGIRRIVDIAPETYADQLHTDDMVVSFDKRTAETLLQHEDRSDAWWRPDPPSHPPTATPNPAPRYRGWRFAETR